MIMGPQLSLGICHDSVLFLPCVRVLPKRWMYFRVVTLKVEFLFGAVCAPCSNKPSVVC